MNKELLAALRPLGTSNSFRSLYNLLDNEVQRELDDLKLPFNLESTYWTQKDWEIMMVRSNLWRTPDENLVKALEIIKPLLNKWQAFYATSENNAWHQTEDRELKIWTHVPRIHCARTESLNLDEAVIGSYTNEKFVDSLVDKGILNPNQITISIDLENLSRGNRACRLYDVKI